MPSQGLYESLRKFVRRRREAMDDLPVSSKALSKQLRSCHPGALKSRIQNIDEFYSVDVFHGLNDLFAMRS